METINQINEFLKLESIKEKIPLSSVRYSEPFLCMTSKGELIPTNQLPYGAKLLRNKKYYAVHEKHDIPAILQINNKKSNREVIQIIRESFARMIVSFFENFSMDEYFLDGIRKISESNLFEQAQTILLNVYNNRVHYTPFAEIDMNK